jgi:hypothetical protein
VIADERYATISIVRSRSTALLVAAQCGRGVGVTPAGVKRQCPPRTMRPLSTRRVRAAPAQALPMQIDRCGRRCASPAYGENRVSDPRPDACFQARLLHRPHARFTTAPRVHGDAAEPVLPARAVTPSRAIDVVARGAAR